jgi:TetR/AcrR family transcriptional regulator
MTVAARREREREARRNRILDAAERVFFDNGFDAAKMEDVAEAAQLGKGTLYLYFKTKDDLALGLAVRHQLALVEEFERARRDAPDGATLLRRLLEAYATRMSTPIEHLKLAMSRWVMAEPFAVDSIGGEQARANIWRIFGIVCEAIERAQRDGNLRDDVPPPRLAVFLLSSVNGALLLRLQACCFAQKNIPIAEHAPSIVDHIDLLLESLGAPAPRRSGARVKKQAL